MLVAVPSAIAFGLLIYAPLGAEFAPHGALAGMLGAIALGLFVPLARGTPWLISAPCAPAAAVLVAMTTTLVRSGTSETGLPLNPHQVPLLLTLTAFLAGSLQMMVGFVGGGRLIKFIPYPVVAGYLCGVGVLIFLGQASKLFGLPGNTGLWSGLVSPALWNWPGLLTGGTTIAIVLWGPRLTRKIPPTILGLAAGMLVYFGLGIKYPELLTLVNNRLVIGLIPTGGTGLSASTGQWTALTHLDMQMLQAIAVPALTLAILLSIDTLKTCLIVDGLTRTRHDSDRELIRQALGNIASALVGGIPGSATMGPTLININSGGQTRLSGALAGMFALGTLLLLGKMVAWVPIASLAGILMVTASRMVDRNIFHLLRHRSTFFDFAVVAAVVASAVSWGLIASTGIGLSMAILLFLREQSRAAIIRRKRYGNQTFSRKCRLSKEMEILQQQGGQTVVCELQGSLFFGTASQLYSDLESDLKTRTCVILVMRHVQSVDFTAVHVLDQIAAQLAERHGTLVIAELHNLPTGEHLRRYLEDAGLFRSDNIRVFTDLDAALEWVEDRVLEENGPPTEDRRTLDLPEIDLLKPLDQAAINVLRDLVSERKLEAGQFVFHGGDPGEELFIIRRGAVRIVLPLADGVSYHLVTHGAGDFFGDLAFLDRGVRSAGAVASNPTDLYVISRSQFDRLAVTHPQIAASLVSRLAIVLALRLRQSTAELQALKES